MLLSHLGIVKAYLNLLFNAIFVAKIFVAWNFLNWLKCIVVTVEIVTSHAVGDFLYSCRWMFRVFDNSMADDTVRNVFLRIFRFCTILFGDFRTILPMFVVGCCRSGAIE